MAFLSQTSSRPVRLSQYVKALNQMKRSDMFKEWNLEFQRHVGSGGVPLGLSIVRRAQLILRDESIITVHHELGVTDPRTQRHRLRSYSYHYEGRRSFRVDKDGRSRPHINDDLGNHLFYPEDTRLELDKINLYTFLCVCLQYMREEKYPTDYEVEYAELVHERWRRIA